MQEYYDITIYSLKKHGKDKHLFRIMNGNRQISFYASFNDDYKNAAMGVAAHQG